jgi:hypothetical protein
MAALVHDHESRERFQSEIVGYLDRLTTAFQSTANYTNAEVDADHQRLILRGVGDPSPVVAEVIREAPDNVDVVWRPVPYTNEELGRETVEVMSRVRELNTGGPRRDGTGLEFTTNDLELLMAVDPQTKLGSRYPVTIRQGGRVIPA